MQRKLVSRVVAIHRTEDGLHQGGDGNDVALPSLRVGERIKDRTVLGSPGSE